MATSSAFGAWLDSVKETLKAAVSNPADDLHAIKAEKNPARQLKLCEAFLKTHAALKKECDLVREFHATAKKEVTVAEDLHAIKAEKDPEQQVKLCKAFLTNHAAYKNECDLVEEFFAAAHKEVGVQRAKKAYMLQMKGQADDEYNPENKFDLKHLTGQSKTALGGDLSDVTGHGMDEAEVAAIKTFTAQDYQYLNPAVANQKNKPDKPDDWMDTYKEKPSILKSQEQIDAEWPEKKKQLYEEGALHAGVIMEGLKKLEAKGGMIYRGFRISPDEFQEKFTVGALLDPTETFQSTSTDPDKAWEFSMGSNKTLPDQTVAVVLEAQLFNGRDIAALSLINSEKEILTLPGTVYKILSIGDMAPEKQIGRPTGAPRATAYKTVKATQIFK
jgi:hypothetical protein